MLDSFIYENHLGQRFIGLDNGVYLNYNDLRDYSWSYDTINSKISRFYRPMTSRKLPLVVAGKNEDQAIAARNRLLDLAEADIEARLPGKIFIGEYYTNGFITGSSKTNYLMSKRICNITLTFTSDDPAWYREKIYPFFSTADSMGTTVGGTSEYPYDYPYDYAVALVGQRIVADSASESAYRLRIFGAATDPAIVISGHTYAVKGNIGGGESLLIDSLTKTITLTTATGEKENWFDKRSRENYIFKGIPPGDNVVSWSGDFGFELTVIEKRSEPKWT